MSSQLPPGIGDVLGPEYLGNQYYGDRKKVPTNYGLISLDRETIRRFWNGAQQDVIDGHWEGRCPCCYTEHTSDGVSDEDRADLVDELLDCCDDVRWLPPSDYLDPCDVCGRSHREQHECTAPAIREPPPDPDQPAECTDCGWTIDRIEDAGSRFAACPECDSNAVKVGEGYE